MKYFLWFFVSLSLTDFAHFAEVEREVLECGDDSFLCADGSQCIHKHEFCDRIQHCRDGSDEIKYRKKEGGYACRGYKILRGRCSLPKSRFTWKQKQKICNPVYKCPERFYKCSNGWQCISEYSFCNGEKDCRDGSDEIAFDATKHTPADGQPCYYGRFPYHCLLPSKFEDNKFSIFCNSEETSCEKNEEFMCSDGITCVYWPRFCDGNADCPGGEDEILYDSTIHSEEGDPCRGWRDLTKVCLFKSEKFSAGKNNATLFCNHESQCRDHEFKCVDGTQCIPGRKFCDGNRDCRDGSDEMRYNSKFHMPVHGRSCRQRNTDNFCLLPPKYDYDYYCFDFEDDCSEMMFRCADGSDCVERGFICDGHSSCRDGSDEIIYDPEIHSAVDGVPCRGWDDFNKICLLPAKSAHTEKDVCNIDFKCAWSLNFKCSHGNFCISKEDYCDGYSQCGDGSDEIRYNSSIHTREDGVSCYSGEWDLPPCLLPSKYDQNAENICDVADSRCPKGLFTCADKKQCIPDEDFCNGEQQCSDGSDELKYNSKFHRPEDGSMCRSKRTGRICLLPPEYDYDYYCSDPDRDCSDIMFRCSDGSGCIERGFVCDGLVSCSDGSDEIIYNPEIHSSKDGVSCRGWDDFSKICLLPAKYAHTEKDVCNTDFKCAWASHFKCSHGKHCISKEDFCDGYSQCGDGSDEIRFDPAVHTEKDGVSCYSGEWEYPPCLLPSIYDQDAEAICDPYNPES